jgi:hypothetical protein
MANDVRPKVTVVLDEDIRAAVERQAEAERSTMSGVCRRVLADWARSIADQPVARLSLAIVLCAALMALSALSAAAQMVTGTPLSASSGNEADATATATLSAPVVAGVQRQAYLCGFSATAGGATAASVVSITVTGLAAGTATWTYGAVTGATTPSAPLVVVFPACLPESAPGTGIAVSMPALGTGNTNAAVNAWGFYR